LLAGYGESRGVFSEQARAFLFIGILGGFTTFSSFGNDTINLIRESLILNALINVAANVMLGLLAVWLGRTISFWIWR
jgi:CrcB protein